jgi:hypothetical protein
MKPEMSVTTNKKAIAADNPISVLKLLLDK